MLRHLFALILAAAAVAAPAADDTSFGIIYLERVFEKSSLIESRSQVLKTEATKVKEAIDGMNAELEKIKTELSVYHPEEAQYQELQEKAQVLQLRRKLYAERHQERLNGMELELLKSSYLEIKELIAQFSKEKGIDLVLLAPSPDLQSKRIGELRIELATHVILYHDQALDLTDAFIAFANGRATGAAEPKPEQGAGAAKQ